MTTQFNLLKNGKNSENVWANPTTKEIVKANKNSFGFNMVLGSDSDFDKIYRYKLNSNQSKTNGSKFSYSYKQMESLGFQLVKRGETPLF